MFRVNSRTCRHKIQTSSLLILVFIYCKSETDQKWSLAPLFWTLGQKKPVFTLSLLLLLGLGFCDPDDSWVFDCGLHHILFIGQHYIFTARHTALLDGIPQRGLTLPCKALQYTLLNLKFKPLSYMCKVTYIFSNTASQTCNVIVLGDENKHGVR